MGGRPGLGLAQRGAGRGAAGRPLEAPDVTAEFERTRVDKWLWAARFYKTRSIAADAVESGKVLVNGARVKPAKALKPGDELLIRVPGADYTVLVRALSDRRGPAPEAAGTAALERLNRPKDAVVLFDKYANGGRSLQVATKGWYWAGRAAVQSGDHMNARAHFERAAATPELFYGQLALERLQQNSREMEALIGRNAPSDALARSA